MALTNIFRFTSRALGRRAVASETRNFLAYSPTPYEIAMTDEILNFHANAIFHSDSFRPLGKSAVASETWHFLAFSSAPYEIARTGEI